MVIPGRLDKPGVWTGQEVILTVDSEPRSQNTQLLQGALSKECAASSFPAREPSPAPSSCEAEPGLAQIPQGRGWGRGRAEGSSHVTCSPAPGKGRACQYLGPRSRAAYLFTVGAIYLREVEMAEFIN